MAIYITGDTHGDFTRFKKDNFPEQKGLTKEDFVIVCGDFGVWDDSPNERHWLDWLEAKPFTTLFVTGNHSNYELLAKLPVEAWHGGRVQKLRPSVIHLMRGQIYELAGRKFFTMGGASSHDIEGGVLEPDDPMFRRKARNLRARGVSYRVNHRTWWKEELPSQEEYGRARAALEETGWSVDYLITHCGPTGVQEEIGGGRYKADQLTDFFEELRGRLKFRYWFFGHYHDNMVVDSQFVLLYEQIVELAMKE